MQKAEETYIEESALFLESIGVPRMAGRILAWLLICEPPEQTMPDLTRHLQASKSSISTMTRMLVQFGMVERVSLTGERKDFYRISPEFWSRSLETAQRKFDGFLRMSQAGLALIECGAENPAELDNRGQRLQEMYEVYNFLAASFPQLVDEWRRHQPRASATSQD
ncbi:MAG: hypothetical protein WDZ49_14215 [Litorilinea sp.]